MTTMMLLPSSRYNNYSEEAQRLLIIKELDVQIKRLFPWLSTTSGRKLRLLYLSKLIGKNISTSNEFTEFELFYSHSNDEVAKGLKDAYDSTVL